jgi:hypothetical protein
MTGKTGGKRKKKGSSSPKKTSVSQGPARETTEIQGTPASSSSVESPSIPPVPPTFTSEQNNVFVVEAEKDHLVIESEIAINEIRHEPYVDENGDEVLESDFHRAVGPDEPIPQRSSSLALDDSGEASEENIFPLDEVSSEIKVQEEERVKSGSPITFIDEQDPVGVVSELESAVSIGESDIEDEVDFVGGVTRGVSRQSQSALLNESIPTIPLPPLTPSDDDEDVDKSDSYKENKSQLADGNIYVGSSVVRNDGEVRVFSDEDDEFYSDEGMSGPPDAPLLPVSHPHRIAGLCQGEMIEDDITDFLVDGQDSVI